MPNSTITATERWDARVGRWVPHAAPTAAAAPSAVVRAPAPAAVGASARRLPAVTRMYANARGTRVSAGFGASGNSSADAELSSSLTQLRARSRQMVRDNPYAKRARTLVVNNVIGPGIGLQAQVKRADGKALLTTVNDDIEAAWSEWCEAANCHTGGVLHFADLERAAVGQVFEAGEVLLRLHYRRFGDSAVPLALELIEAERLAGEFETINGVDPGSRNQVRMGVEVDRFGRPVAYYIRNRHPGDLRFTPADADLFDRVPADQVFHLRLADRWPQTRGEPWLHTVLNKLDAMNEYSAAEVDAARDSAFYFATVTSQPDEETGGPGGSVAPEGLAAGSTGGSTSSRPTYDLVSGMVQHLEPGEELNFHAPNRPNTAIDAFLRYMLREIAAGASMSYASLSQDFSQTNYSSSRLSLLDDRDCWRTLQQWWVRAFRAPLHRRWMQQASAAGALRAVPFERFAADVRRYTAVLFKPRGWSWIDPAKEVAAYRQAELAGYVSKSQVIAQFGNGADVEDYIAERRRELDLLEEAEIVTDTVPGAAAPLAAPGAAAAPDDEEDDPPGAAPDGEDDNEDDPPARVVSFRR